MPIDPGRLAAVLGEFATKTLVDMRLDSERLSSSAADLAWQAERAAEEARAAIDRADGDIDANLRSAGTTTRAATEISNVVALAIRRADLMAAEVTVAKLDVAAHTARWTAARVEAEAGLRSAQAVLDSAPPRQRGSAADPVARGHAEIARCEDALARCERAASLLMVAGMRAADASSLGGSARKFAETATRAAVEATSLAEQAISKLEEGRLASEAALGAAGHVQTASREVVQASREACEVGRRTEAALEDLAGQLAMIDRGPW